MLNLGSTFESARTCSTVILSSLVTTRHMSIRVDVTEFFFDMHGEDCKEKLANVSPFTKVKFSMTKTCLCKRVIKMFGLHYLHE